METGDAQKIDATLMAKDYYQVLIASDDPTEMEEWHRYNRKLVQSLETGLLYREAWKYLQRPLNDNPYHDD